MATATLVTDLDMVRGDTGEWTFTFTDDSTPPVPVNDPAATYTMSARVALLDATTVFIAGPFAQSTPGTATMIVTPTMTNALARREICLYYDVEVVEAGGRTTTIARGHLFVHPDVT